VRGHQLQAERIERVVVRGTNWVGDAVMTVPALRALRRVLPQAHITLAIRPWAEGLFADADFIDDLLLYERGPRDLLLRSPLRQAVEWRRRRFCLAVLFQNAFEAALLAAAARIPHRLGYATDGRRPLLTHPLPLPAWRSERHEVFYYLNIVAELERLLYGTTSTLSEAPVYRLRVSPERQARAREMLNALGANPARPLVALCPGSTNSRAKRWPARAYAALADQLIAEAGADVALFGSQDEMEVSTEVQALMRQRPLMLTGRTKLSEAVALLSLVDALVTNDTGPAHIAASLNRPTLVIFGPTDPRTTRPFSQTASVIRRPPDCAPCMLRDCPIDHRCMTAITPEEIFGRTLALLKRETLAEARV
jgi:heptosyltransferase-2